MRISLRSVSLSVIHEVVAEIRSLMPKNSQVRGNSRDKLKICQRSTRMNYALNKFLYNFFA